jgi:ribosomal-protein-alanine N-acetyltransferase
MFKFSPVTLETIKEVGNWKYNGVVKSIYTTPYLESIIAEECIKGPDGCDGFIAFIKHSIAGLFEFYFEDDIMEIGVALNPDLVGKGLGKEFIESGIDFGIKNYNYNYKKEYIRLTVNEKNQSAVKVYEKVGFSYHSNNGDSIEMRKLLK